MKRNDSGVVWTACLPCVEFPIDIEIKFICGTSDTIWLDDMCWLGTRYKHLTLPRLLINQTSESEDCREQPVLWDVCLLLLSLSITASSVMLSLDPLISWPAYHFSWKLQRTRKSPSCQRVALKHWIKRTGRWDMCPAMTGYPADSGLLQAYRKPRWIS